MRRSALSSANQEFIVLINSVMVNGIQSGADIDVMAQVYLNTAYELYKHYGACEGYDSFFEFVASVCFEVAEVEEWLDEVEGRPEKSD